MKKITLSVLAMVLFFCTTIKAQTESGFHILKTFHIASAGSWDYIAVGPGNNRLYVSHGTQVNILDETTGDSIGVIPNTIGVHGIAFDKRKNKGFTSNGKLNTVTVFDLTSNAVLKQVATGEGPDAIFFDDFSRTIITCNGHGKSLSIIDPVKDTVITTIPLEGKPETAVSDNTDKIYVNIEDKNEIAMISTITFTVEAYWPLYPAEGPAGLAIDLKNHLLFSGCSDSRLLMVINMFNGEIVDSLPIGNHCDGVTFDSKTNNIFASNGDGTLTVIHEKSASSFEVVENVSTKKGAKTAAVDEKSHLIYLPTADFEKVLPSDNDSPKPKPKMIPGTFEVLVVGK
jgi:hypothetical protein